MLSNSKREYSQPSSPSHPALCSRLICIQVLNVDGPAVADTDDFDGSPPGKDSQQISHRWFWQKQTTFWRTNVYVLWFKLMEKIFYDTFSSTQRTTFVQLFGYSNADASSLSSVFGTIAFLTPLLGGWLGKRWLLHVTMGSVLHADSASRSSVCIPMFARTCRSVAKCVLICAPAQHCFRG